MGVTIECGTDNVLAVFERWHAPPENAPRVRLAMVIRDDDFADVTGLRHGIDSATSPPPAKGSYYLLVAFTNPYCGSSWRSFRYIALEPTFDPKRPHVLVDEPEPVHLRWQGFELDARAQAFSVRFAEWQRHDFTQSFARIALADLGAVQK